MKKLAIFGILSIFLIIVSFAIENSFANEYVVLDDTIFTYPHGVCIDPGHGGPTAQKYNNNGDGLGTLGCGNYYGDSLSEQWVNLQVAYKLQDFLWWGICLGFSFQRVVMTRTGETDIPVPYPGFWQRIMRSRYGNAGGPVYEFISIHHNGFTTMADQGTESFWCDYEYTLDSGFVRDTSSALARKVCCKVHDYFNSDAECYECYEDRGTELKYDNYVLNRVVSAHVLSEASDIHVHCDEAAIFADDPNGWHARVEANGIFEGWCSYKRNAGFVTVKNKSLHGEDGWVIIDGPETPETYFASPYSSVWRDGETWRIVFLPYQYIGGVIDTFHHCRELETGIYSTNPGLSYTVPQCSTHTIIGYYRGGPYEANLFMPDGGEEWLVGDSGLILWWQTDSGLDTTTLIDIFLDRNGGQGGYGEILFTGISIQDGLGIFWQVTGPASNKCRIKIVAHDCVDNTATDVSSYNFTIRFPNILGDVNTDGIVSISDVVYLINYLFKSGPGFEPFWKGDTNGDCKVSLGDIVYLINYLTKGGPAPVCNGSCWACMRAVVKEDENPFVKDPSLTKKIYKQ
jgi:N-acetylmuramoyl-L-alanine amidase